MKTIIIKGLPDYMIRRILQKEVSDTELAYANIRTILFIQSGESGTLVVFDVKSEWNYITDASIEDLFGLLSGDDGSTTAESELNR